MKIKLKAPKSKKIQRQLDGIDCNVATNYKTTIAQAESIRILQTEYGVLSRKMIALDQRLLALENKVTE